MPRPIFAIVSCIRSANREHDLQSTSLFRTFLPSIEQTVTPLERERWSVQLYLCADDDDVLFINSTRFIENASPTSIRVKLLFVARVPNRVPIREAVEVARRDGAEFFHRTNDDIKYLSAGWLTASVRALLALTPPNVGVAGPKVYGDGSTNKLHGGMTIDVVHRTHLKIFSEYYPPQLSNWYTDTWMVYVYVHTLGDRKRVVKLLRSHNFSVMHAFQRRRYTPSTDQLKLLPALTECGRQLIAAYINATRGLQRERHTRPTSCRAYERLPTDRAGTQCYARSQQIGGLEMSSRDVQRNAKRIEGYCHETVLRRGAARVVAPSAHAQGQGIGRR
jgi:hypothetical protein